MIIYMDNSATTKVCPEAAHVMTKLMTESYGNPSSLHSMGLESEKAVLITEKEALEAEITASPSPKGRVN